MNELYDQSLDLCNYEEPYIVFLDNIKFCLLYILTSSPSSLVSYIIWSLYEIRGLDTQPPPLSITRDNDNAALKLLSLGQDLFLQLHLNPHFVLLLLLIPKH